VRAGGETFCEQKALPPLPELAERRCRFIAEKQQSCRPSSGLDGAFLIYDNEEECQFYDPRYDYNAGRERVGMGLALAAYLQKWPDSTLEKALHRYADFVRRELVNPDTGEVYNDYHRDNSYKRLYNAPWYARLYIEFFNLWQKKEYLETACKILRFYYAEGGSRFYPIQMPVAELIPLLRSNGLTIQADALMAEFGLTTEMLDFNIDDFSVEELREKFEALKTTGSEPAANAGNPESFALEGQFRDELFGALESEKVETCWGMDSHYWFWDYDRDASEVYATDVTDWNLYGFPYSMDGDHVVIDFAGKKRMKLSLVPFDEGGQADPISGMFAKITEKYSANDTQWAEKYQTASDTISSMENELGTLRQFKTDTEDAAAKGEREKVFAQFEDLVGVEAFENLREHCTEYAVDVLEEKCYAIRGRNGTAAKFSVEPKSPKLVVEKTSVTPEPYGGVFTEYGIASRNQHN